MPGLYGISHSNRTEEDYWGKNCFNSSFPIALTNYMRSQGHTVNYIRLKSDLKTEIVQMDVADLYNCKYTDANGKSIERNNEQLYFAFETAYKDYGKYVRGSLDGIDCVVCSSDENGNLQKQLRPLEIKLTVIPDKTTVKKTADKWSSEMVIRISTTMYAALNIMDKINNEPVSKGEKTEREKAREILEPVCSQIQQWDNRREIIDDMPNIVNALDEFQKSYCYLQQPLVMEPVWRTCEQSPFLQDDAFDVFVWSDMALMRQVINRAKKEIKQQADKEHRAEEKRKTIKKSNNVSRLYRCASRYIHALYEMSSSGSIDINNIYRSTALGNQTDKEFAASGTVTWEYLHCKRLEHPIIKKDELFNIVLKGGENKLMPERRFDQTVYFTMREAVKEAKQKEENGETKT